MKQREPRRNVLIRARMRNGPSWADVNIRNISSRGLMVQATSSPPRGSYVELRRGRHAIVARVAWSSGPRFGLQTQDRLDVEAIVAEPDQSSVDYGKAKAADPTFERRTETRVSSRQEIERRAERSRLYARLGQFAGIGAIALVLVGGVVGAVLTVLPAPMAAVSSALQ